MQVLEADTVQHIFYENLALCNDVSERTVQQIVHSIEQHGRHVCYLRLLKTLIKAEGQLVRKTQDCVMSEVRFYILFHVIFCYLKMFEVLFMYFV